MDSNEPQNVQQNVADSLGALSTETINASGNVPEVGWRAVAELAVELGRPSNVLRRYIARNVPREHVRYVTRPQGGKAEMWVAPGVVEMLRHQYANVPASPGTFIGHVAMNVPENVRGNVPTQDDSAEQAAANVPSAVGNVPEGVVGRATVDVQHLVELERKAAVADLLGPEVERLTAELTAARDRIEVVERRADTAETLTRRARQDADRWRGEAEAIRLAWHTWRRSMDGVGRVALWRRRFPSEPPEFSAGPAIEMRPTEQ